MKKVLVSFVFLVFIYLGAAFGFSAYTQSQYDEFVVRTEKVLSSRGGRIVEQSYDKGLLTSYGTLVISMPVNSDLGSDEALLNIKTELRSGPWLGEAGFGRFKMHIDISSASTDKDEDLFYLWGGKTVISFDNSISLTGKEDVQLNILPFQYEDDELKTSFQGATGVEKDDAFVLTAPLFDLSFKNKYRGNESLKIEGITFELKQQNDLTALNSNITELKTLGLADGVLSIEQITALEEDGGYSYTLKNLLVNAQNELLSGGLINSSLKSEAAITGNEQSVFVKLDYSQKNIDYNVLQMIQNTASFDQRDKLLFDLLKAQPSIDFNLSLDDGKETAMMNGQFGLAQLNSMDLDRGNLMMLLMTKGQAQVDIKIPTAFKGLSVFDTDGSSQFLLNQLSDEGVLVRKGNDYVGQYSYNGQDGILINGESSKF